MDKPISLSVKDFLVRKMAVKLMVSESVIDAVVTHQLKSAMTAMKKPENNSVELAGFGKFLFNAEKAKKKYIKNLSKAEYFGSLEKDESLSEEKRISYGNKLRNTLDTIEELKPKIEYLYGSEFRTNSGGMEEQVDSPSEHEGTH